METKILPQVLKDLKRINSLWRRSCYYIECLLFRRYNRLHIKTLPVTWTDAVEKLPHAMFQILTDFIEEEKPDTHINWDSDPLHRKVRDKMDELYNWWHNVYLKFDPWKDFDYSKGSSSPFLPNADGTYAMNLNEYEKSFYNTVNALEKQMKKELHRRCKELIDIRESLWT